jgi:tripartite-type tricarboxylate transporter receptor subunit TctC
MGSKVRCLAVLAAVFSSGALAQGWPSKTITIFEPFGAGGLADVEVRRLAPVLEKALGRSVIIDNKPGAGGLISLEALSKAAPDGHTFAWVTASVPAYKVLVKDLRFEPTRDLAPVSLVLDFPSGFVINPQVPANTIEEFLAYAKANPGKVNYGSFGRTTTMMIAEAFGRATGVKLVSVPFSTFGQMIAGLQRNDVQLLQIPYNFALKSQVESGQLRALLKIGNRRAQALPNVPTASEKGWNIPGNGWQGIMAPAGTPKPVIDRMAAEIARFVASPEVQKLAKDTGNDYMSSTPEQFRQQIDNDARYWNELANALGLKPE